MQLTPCDDPERLAETAYFDLLEVDIDDLDVWRIGYLSEFNGKKFLDYQEHCIYQDIPKENFKLAEKLNNDANIQLCIERFTDEEFERFTKA